MDINIACSEAQNHELLGIRGLANISRSNSAVDKVGIKNVELVALHRFRWRIVVIIVRLVVFVPFVSA